MCAENSRKPSGHVNPERDMKVNIGLKAVSCVQQQETRVGLATDALSSARRDPSADNLH